ncbi:hypothetical protein COE92_14270 [Bacillus wiedmannii]|uniref:hypothetical protein n=1 Tax=Bacillus wiedmannii TaxID=1890302 RepID=UPI000BFE5F80|nr:hypothetical protein [Bacillus wiedmannii]PHB54547.1 hypothetical protein COE92_14270 [Bacillus wiedmannii]
MAKFTPEQIERAAANGISKQLLYERTSKKGKMSIEEAITTPKMSKAEAGRKGKENGPDFTFKRGELK